MPAEREQFVALFGDLLENSYITKIESYSGEKIQYPGDAIDGDLAVVKTRIVTKQGTEIPIDYRMFLTGGRWAVYDVSIEGISLIGTWMQTIALSWLVYRMTHSTMLLGIVGFSGQIFTFLVAPFAGVLAERGFITFAPHNLYRGEDRYRWLDRRIGEMRADRSDNERHWERGQHRCGDRCRGPYDRSCHLRRRYRDH
jgi:hypothetical protein